MLQLAQRTSNRKYILYFYHELKINLMKKIALIASIAFLTFSCNQSEKTPAAVKTPASSEKTAFVETAKLFEEYTKLKDLEAKYKAKSESMAKNLESQIKSFQAEVQAYQQVAQSKSPDWVKSKQSELMAKEQKLQQMQQSMGQDLQKQSATEMDSLYKEVKKFIGEYGKKHGYTYIYATGEPASILYGKEELDITEEIIKELNAKK